MMDRAPDSYFTGIPNSVLDLVTELKPPACVWAVLLHLHRRANRDGASWWSIPRMMEACGLSRSSVVRAISWLETHDLTRVERSKGDSSVYFLKPVSKLTRGSVKTDTPTRVKTDTPLYIRTEEEPVEEEPRRRTNARKTVLSLVSTLEIPSDLEVHRVPIENWIAYKKEMGKGYKPRGLLALWARLRKLRDIPSAVEDSMAAGYAGLFDAKGENKPRRESMSDQYRRLMGDA